MVAWKHLFSCWERKVLFSTIAKLGMFGLAMMLKENFFCLLNPVHLFDHKICSWKRRHGSTWHVQNESHHREVDLRQNMYSILCFCFFTYLFNVCLIIFLFFYICNVWFVLANTRILIFLILKFVAMFLPVSMNKFCN